jgi:hypothetical protein
MHSQATVIRVLETHFGSGSCWLNICSFIITTRELVFAYLHRTAAHLVA